MLIRNASQRRRRAAFTLMEMLVVVAIIVALAGIGGFFLMGALKGSQKDIAATQVKGPLTNAVQTYALKNNMKYPQTLDELLDPDPDKGGPFLVNKDALIDPWGNRYQYDSQGQKNGGRQPDIWAVAPGGELIGNWEKTARTN
jgi:general secretion pathway protein G